MNEQFYQQMHMGMPPDMMMMGQSPPQEQLLQHPSIYFGHRAPFDPLILYGSIKVVDGLFITDEIAAHVSPMTAGPRIHISQQGQTSDQLLRQSNSQSLVLNRPRVHELQLVRRGGNVHQYFS